MRRIALLLALVLVALPLAAHAQWSDDPLVNLAIADRPSEQVVPKIAATADGGCYVAWFDLASGNNASFATCDQCVLVTQDVSGTTASKYFYQSAGSIQVNKPPISSGGISGSLSNVTLVEVTIDSNYVSTPVPGGACLHVSSASFDAGCGNNVLESGEACDGTALGSSTCSTFGFTGGQLGCSSSCQYDTSGCTGFSCSATDLGTFAGTTLNETGDTCTATSQYDVAQSPTSACSFNDSPGPERLYALTLQPGTKVRVDLTNIAFDAALWVVTSCADKTGNTCVDISDTLGNESLTLENTSSADATYYVIVDGYSTSDCGTYALTISDIAVPGSWTCDPSYFAALDGCDCECGAWDPDCNDPNASVYGCSSSQSCVQPGVCQ